VGGLINSLGDPFELSGSALCLTAYHCAAPFSPSRVEEKHQTASQTDPNNSRD